MATQHQLHVVMFPWLAHGHITPFLELAKSLLSYELRISFVSTPLNIARIKKKIVPGIELVELPLPSVDGLPVGVESTAGLSEIGRTDLIPLLFQAVDLCEQPFATLLKLLSSDFVIHDTTLFWTPRVAAKLGIPTINFTGISMTSLSFVMGQHRHGLPEIPTASDLCALPLGFPSEVVRNRLFEARNQLPLYQKKQHGICEGLSFVDRHCVSVEESWATACNTCLELEGKFVDYFQRSTGWLMFPVGILLQSLPLRPAAEPCVRGCCLGETSMLLGLRRFMVEKSKEDQNSIPASKGVQSDCRAEVLELGSAYRRSPSSWKCLDLTDKYLKDRRCRTGKPSPVIVGIRAQGFDTPS
ncbi:anthocyanidin-3-O-glucoside rhamnosyltransferase-like [Cryptomeria japonica]|uniref:anthocyanidin-3-O-glucoside rhamnosyltransferase-like n=1 Tax=Cryptomeria japonica TaxID=3369 RepID=UPI0027DAA5F0|nr:anthocyanidin-3-O-glucoside rhamnosyltransferase-like [Cryptomeria japonica]